MQVEEQRNQIPIQPQRQGEQQEMQISTNKEEENPLDSEAIKVRNFFPTYLSNQNSLVGNRIY